MHDAIPGRLQSPCTSTCASLHRSLYSLLRDITGATFALIYKQQQRRLTAIEMLRFFDWSYRAGAKLADELQYVPMPNDVAQMIESAWAEVTDAHGQPAWTEPTTAKH